MNRNTAVVAVKPKKLDLVEMDCPAPGHDQVRIRTQRSAISIGTEMTVYTGEFPSGSVWAQAFTYPFTLGYCNVGTVETVGEGVSPEWVGTRVLSDGTHSTWAVTSVDKLYAVPEDVSDEEAALIRLAPLTMNGVRRSGLQWGDAVVVYGLGLLGQLAARWAMLAGAWPVIGIDVAAERLAFLPDHPGCIGVNPSEEDVVARVKELTHGRMADMVFEVTGNAELIPREFAVLKPQGRFVVLSSPRGPTQFDFHDLCNRGSYTIIGTHAYSQPMTATPENPWTEQRNLEATMDYVQAGLVDLTSLVTHRVPFREAPGIYKQLLVDRSPYMGIILEWN